VFLLNVDSVDLSAGTVNMDLLLYTRDESNKPYFNDTLRLGNTYRLSRIDAMPNYYRLKHRNIRGINSLCVSELE
jgi:hypothetical protein